MVDNIKMNNLANHNPAPYQLIKNRGLIKKQKKNHKNFCPLIQNPSNHKMRRRKHYRKNIKLSFFRRMGPSMTPEVESNRNGGQVRPVGERVRSTLVSPKTNVNDI